MPTANDHSRAIWQWKDKKETTQPHMLKHCFICPTYGNYDYARAALESFFAHTKNGVAVVADDAHPGFHEFWERNWNVVARHFTTRGGVTRSWNFGLTCARELGANYAICGNDDILFTPGWEIGPIALLKESSVGLVGPLSNGPGKTNGEQNIWDHVPGYSPSDNAEHLSSTASFLRDRFRETDHVAVPAINGFFTISHTSTWWEGRFDNDHVFDPSQRFAMVGSEMELQERLRAKGRQSVVSRQTYIFHYRSVTRGERCKHGMWYRREPAAITPKTESSATFPKASGELSS